MKVYIGNTGRIKNHKNFKILFWSWESKKLMFTIFPGFFPKSDSELRVLQEVKDRVQKPPQGLTASAADQGCRTFCWTPKTY